MSITQTTIEAGVGGALTGIPLGLGGVMLALALSYTMYDRRNEFEGGSILFLFTAASASLSAALGNVLLNNADMSAGQVATAAAVGAAACQCRSDGWLKIFLSR